MGLLEKFGFGRAAPKAPPVAPAKGKGASYMRGEGNPFFLGWRPALRDARQDVGEGYRLATARAIDMAQNSGWIAGAIEASIAQTIGSGLRLNARPDAEEIGWDEAQCDEWGRMVERKFGAWSSDATECDLGGRMNLGQLQAAAMKQWFATGEMVIALPYRRRFASAVGTKVHLIPSHRLDLLSYTFGNVVQGVFLDNDGFPIGYRFKLMTPDNGLGFEQWVDMPARDKYGRPQVVHIFDGNAGAVRGITPLAPALRVLRQFDQLADATLTSALIQTIFAATLESNAPTEQVLQALQGEDEQGAGIGAPTMDDFFNARAGWYSQANVDLGQHGKIAHLFPGESLKFNKTEHPNTEYEAFAKFLLREIARCIGVTFEQLTGDYSGATYSSVRMATSEFWNITCYRRTNLIGRLTQAIYEAWLEEQVELGLIEVPGGIVNFLTNRAAFCRADWRGPPKPQADDLKAAKAHETWRALGIVSDEMLCSELGTDWEEVYLQRASEKALREKLGIEPPPDAPPVTAGIGTASEQGANAPDEEPVGGGNG